MSPFTLTMHQKCVSWAVPQTTLCALPQIHCWFQGASLRQDEDKEGETEEEGKEEGRKGVRE